MTDGRLAYVGRVVLVAWAQVGGPSDDGPGEPFVIPAIDGAKHEASLRAKHPQRPPHQRDGASAPRAIMRAALRRARPILMTTLAALLGALPLMLGDGWGSELQIGRAHV